MSTGQHPNVPKFTAEHKTKLFSIYFLHTGTDGYYYWDKGSKYSKNKLEIQLYAQYTIVKESKR